MSWAATDAGGAAESSLDVAAPKNPSELQIALHCSMSIEGKGFANSVFASPGRILIIVDLGRIGFRLEVQR
jgi:hypothetical protein